MSNNELSKISDATIEEVIENSKTMDTSVSLLYRAPGVALLLQFLATLASCGPDPSLVNESMEKSDFIHLKTPTSLRASLYQIASSMSSAFHTSNYSMNSIRAQLIDLPLCLAKILESSRTGDEKCKRLMSRTILNLQKASNTCKEMANKAQEAFHNITPALVELNTAVTITKTESERNIEDGNRMKSQLVQEEEHMKKFIKEFEDLYLIASQQKKESNDDFREQMKKSEDLTTIFIAAAGDGMINVAAKQNLKQQLLHYGFKMGMERFNDYLVHSQNSAQMIDFAKFAMLEKLIEDMSEVANSMKDPKDLEIDECVAKLRFYKNQSLNGAEGKDLLNHAKNIFNFLEKNVHKIKEEEEIEKKCIELATAALQQIDISKRALESQQAFQPKNDQNKKSEFSLCEKILKSDTEKTNTAHENYKEKSENEEKLRKELYEGREKLRDIVSKLQNIDTTKVELSQIIEHLRTGINYLSELEKNWRDLVTFFDNIQILVQTNFGQNVSNFIEEAKDTIDEDLLIQYGLKAISYSMQICNCAEIYSAISEKFVMPTICNVGKQYALTEGEAQQKQTQLENNLQIVEMEVEKLINEKMDEFKDRIDEKMRTYAKSLNQAMQPAIKD